MGEMSADGVCESRGSSAREGKALGWITNKRIQKESKENRTH